MQPDGVVSSTTDDEQTPTLLLVLEREHDRSHAFGFCPGRHAAAPVRHPSAQLRLRTAHAGDDIDGAGQCFRFVADPAASPTLLV